jgi:hypothetical protein
MDFVIPAPAGIQTKNSECHAETAETAETAEGAEGAERIRR